MGDKQAIERYRYMLQTAPPDDIERAHAEAFERLSPEQRKVVLNELSQRVPASEVGGDDPKSLARMATRAEMREPGTMERTFGNVRGPGMGGMFLSTLAGVFVGTAIADSFFGQDSADSAAEGDSGADAGADEEMAGGDDFGGGDFGGGDFGGGDFGGI
ncbi:MAG: hypothetical protein ABIZ57_02405 [Candidatus Limnocylindria bacterium]